MIAQDLGHSILLEMKIHKDIRRPYETGLWIDIARFVNPRREDIGQDTWSKMKGQRKGKDVYDGTPLGALNTWADGMQGFLVSESLNWFRSEMSVPWLNTIDEVRIWLQEYDRRMYSAFRRGNFYSVVGEWFRDAGSVGTATLYTEEDIGYFRAVHTAIHPREVYIAENKFGQVDTVFREFEKTARQAVQKFGDAVSDDIKKNADEHPEKRHLFIHALFPNDDQWPVGETKTNKRFKSVYVEQQATGPSMPSAGVANILREGGYDINPYAVWRFRKNSDEIYGYSPAADALTEVFSLNQFGKTLVQAAQQSVRPALNVPKEMRGNVRMLPNGYNYYENPDRVITAVNSRIDYPVGIDQLERLQKSLEEKYRVRYFQMLTRADVGKQRKTVEEIIEMKSEQAVLMGPQVDRLYDEGLKKVFDISSEIERKSGTFSPANGMPPLPDIVFETGSEININLTGPLPQAQKRLFKMQPIQMGLNNLAQIATVKPNVIDIVDWDGTAEDSLEAGAFPQHRILSDEQVAEIRRKRAEDEAREKMLEMGGGAAEGYGKVTKAPEAGSPAEAIVGA